MKSWTEARKCLTNVCENKRCGILTWRAVWLLLSWSWLTGETKGWQSSNTRSWQAAWQVYLQPADRNNHRITDKLVNNWITHITLWDVCKCLICNVYANKLKLSVSCVQSGKPPQDTSDVSKTAKLKWPYIYIPETTTFCLYSYGLFCLNLKKILIWHLHQCDCFLALMTQVYPSS